MAKAKRTKKVKPVIYTIGYEGLDIDDFLKLLKKNKIKRIIDVRKNPISRKFGFTKSRFRSMADAVGIGYEHLPGLGVPKALRKTIKTPEDRQRVFKFYEEKLLPKAVEEKAAALEMIKEKPSVLVCYERDPIDCHRTIVANELKKMSRLQVRNIVA